ncbi:MAG: PaaI family thioesterase [Pseudomonadota bacterium]|nr:PaaI family thioesterase [Pseudomonadota bacterium]
MSINKESYFEQDYFAKSLGIRLTHCQDEYARCEMTLTQAHKNGLGSLHGAVIFSLADIAFAAACNSVQSSIGLQADLKYLRKPQGEILTAEARAVSTSNRIGHYQVVISDERGSSVAIFSSTAYRLPPKSD